MTIYYTVDGQRYATPDEAAQAVIDEDTSELEDAYRDMLDDCYEPIKIGEAEYCISDVLEAVDPIAYRCGMRDWESGEIEGITCEIARLDVGDSLVIHGCEVAVEEDETEGDSDGTD